MDVNYKDEFIKIYNEKIKRDGADKLLDWLLKSDFFTSPASTKFHSNYPGGLVEHTVKAYKRFVRNLEKEYGKNVEYEIISTKNISNYALPASGGPITGGLINAIENGSIIESGGYTLLGYGDVAANQVTGSLFGSGAGATSIRSSTAANLFHYTQDTNSSYKIFTDWWIRYGIELPDTGTMGQIFFLKSS